jgi:hypothetical protein
VATDAPRISRLQAIVVMAWKRSSVRFRNPVEAEQMRCEFTRWTSILGRH